MKRSSSTFAYERTKRLAQKIASALGAELEEITSPHAREGLMGYVY